MTDLYEEAAKVVGRENVKTDEPMSRHTTFRIGGAADYFVKPSSAGQIAGLMELCRENEIPFYIVGNGSNLLVSDSGVRGMVISVMENMDSVTVDDCRMTAQAGALLGRAAVTAAEHSLSGMEFASGIPGTIGGAVYMNAGAYGGEMSHIVESVTVMDHQGHAYVLEGREMEFGYRKSAAENHNLIVLDVTVRLERGSSTDIDARMKELSSARRAKQPLEYPSAGSTFKRPEGYFAGKLIMDAGLAGYSVGGAQVSEKHCGFVLNRGGATADDVLTLIRGVQRRVYDTFGVVLETEVKMLGEF